MKKIIKDVIIVISIIILNQSLFSMKGKAQPRVNVSFDVFYNELSPYGEWIQEPNYGYVWIPSAGNDFRPYYTNGRWVMTEYGNTWVSDYDWGWAPFHYGRWTYARRYGWIWIPDSEWGPAWVAWRGNNDYYGWAPLSPVLSISLSIGNYSPPDDWWVFIPPAYIYEPRWHNYYQGYGNNTTIIHNTTIINNTYIDKSRTYIAGPRVDDIRRRTNREVSVYKIGNENRPGRTVINKDRVNIYRPEVARSKKVSAPPKARKAERSFDRPESISGSRNTSNFNRTNEKNEIKQGGETGRRKQDTRPVPPNRLERQEQKQAPQNRERKQDMRQVPQNRQERQQQSQSPQNRERKQDIRHAPQNRPQRQQQSQSPQNRERKQDMRQPPQNRPQRQEQIQSPQNRERKQDIRQAPQNRPQRQETRQQPQQNRPPRQEIRQQPQQRPAQQRGGEKNNDNGRGKNK